MADTTVSVSDPELVATKAVDKSGRMYLGEDYAGKNVRIIIDRVEEGNE